MIIDFRVRPPARSFSNLGIYRRIESGGRPLDWHGPLPASVTERSMEKFLGEMKACGIVHGVVWGRAVADPGASTTNDDVAAIVREGNGLLSGFGGIAIPGAGETTAAVEEVERTIAGLGLKGITIEPGLTYSPTFGADDPRLYPIYQRCQELGAILALTVSVRAGTDLGCSSPIAVDRVAGDFPDLEIVVSHAFWPWVAESCGLAYRRPNVYLLPDVYGIDFPGHMQWVEAANTYLQDRLLFGSAYPLIGLETAVEGNGRLPYTEEAREKVMYRNAARMLGLAS